MNKLKRSSSDSCDSAPSSPEKQIKLSQYITKHPGRFVGSGTTDIENCLINDIQAPKRTRATPAKRLSKFSPIRFMRAPVLKPKNSRIVNDLAVNRNCVAKNLFGDVCHGTNNDYSIVDPLLNEEWTEEFNFRVKNFTNLLVDVLGDSSTFHLIGLDELNNVSKFLNLPSHCKELYIQMFHRKHKWHCVSDINYGPNVVETFKELEACGFVSSNIISNDLDDVLEMVKVSDLKQLCKEFNLKPGGKAKTELIRMLLKYARSQRTLLNTDSSSLLKEKVSKILGHCIKLNDGIHELFHRINILFSVPFSGDDNVERNTLHNSLHFNYVEMGKMVYPSFNVIKTVPVFGSKESLLKYEKAIVMEKELLEVIARKAWDILGVFIDETWACFKDVLQDETEKELALRLPLYLRCFTAGSVYTRMLFTGVHRLKIVNKDFHEDAMQILRELLNQDVYYPQHRGAWYDLLVSLLKTKRPLAAARTVIQALKDPELNEIQRSTLSSRASRLLVQKKPLPKKLRSQLKDVLVEPFEEPDFNIIEAKSLQKNKQGFKLIYIQEDGAEGTMYSTVEELVISHYKQFGYLRGMHAENKFIISLFGLIFWDIIYERAVLNVFQSKYQSQPLDLKSKLFYANRQELIDARLEEMHLWTVEYIKNLVAQRYNDHQNKLSIVHWNKFSNVKEMMELIACIGMHVLTLLCERMAKSYATACTGFPDLILWTLGQEDKCKFVEVKGQGDRLSPDQKLWMDYLMNIGADAEVCLVRRIGHRIIPKKKATSSSRSTKRKVKKE